MAQLDPLLQALAERNAQELVLAASQRPVFRFGDDQRAVSQQALSSSQITALLAELGDDVEAARLSSGQPISFVYRTPDGRAFLCEAASGQDGALRARFTAHTPRPTPAQTTPTERPAGSAAGPRATAPAPSPVAETRPHRPNVDSRPAGSNSIEGSSEMERYLIRMVELGASDLHLSAGEVPRVRLHGEITELPGAPRCSADGSLELLQTIMPERNRQEFLEIHDTDFAHEISGVARFRANAFMDRNGAGAVFRVIPEEILTAEQLGLSQAILGLCGLAKGLVLVTGPTGSGKSTTLAAMVDHINRTRSDHIITIEDPIEFVHPNRTCLINQREIVTHTGGFKKALRAALREDPDIVLVGEMRDLETIAIAIETAETGHLVFGTLHTTTACSTVDRIIDQFPADRQAQIRTMLAESLKGVVSQTLLKRVGGGRVAAIETLLVTPAISNLIREGKTFQIPSLMQTGRALGMVLLNDALTDLVKRGIVEAEEAYRKAIDKAGLVTQFGRAGIKYEAATKS